MNIVFQDIFKLEVEKMIKESEYIEPLNHKGVKGTIRELGLANLLKNFLPTYCQIGTGEIHDYNGKISNQTDLIIYNRDILPPILFDSNLGIYPIESVIYAIEIKTTSRNDDIIKTIKNFRNLKKLNSTNMYRTITAYFAYKSDLTVKSELERYFENDNAIDPSIRVLCIAGEGYYCHMAIGIEPNLLVINEEGQMIKGDILIRWVGLKARENYEVVAFLAGILNTTRSASVGKYILNEELFNVYFEAVIDKEHGVVYENKDFNGIPNNKQLRLERS